MKCTEIVKISGLIVGLAGGLYLTSQIFGQDVPPATQCDPATGVACTATIGSVTIGAPTYSPVATDGTRCASVTTSTPLTCNTGDNSNCGLCTYDVLGVGNDANNRWSYVDSLSSSDLLLDCGGTYSFTYKTTFCNLKPNTFYKIFFYNTPQTPGCDGGCPTKDEINGEDSPWSLYGSSSVAGQLLSSPQCP